MLPGKIQQLIRASAYPKPLPGANYTFIAHPKYCFSDVNHTIPCGPGDAIQWFYDPSALAWFQQATSGSRMVLRQTGSKYYAEASGSQTHPWANMSGLNALTTNTGVAFQLYTNITFQMPLSNYAASFSSREFRQYSTFAKMSITINGNDQPETNTFSYNMDLQYLITGGSTSSIYRGGTFVLSGPDVSRSLATLTSIGSRTDGTYGMNGRIYGAVFTPSGISMTTIQTWLRSLQP